jgi:tRNA (uracil-5-)-methyltransferase TRM9
MTSKKIKETLKETYNTIASDFGKTRQIVWKPVEEFIAKLPKQSLVLDLGGGTGRHSLLAEQYAHKSICYDQSIGQLHEARKNGVSSTVLGDITKIPFIENSIDAIVYIAALHHLPTEEERIESLTECKRVLKNTGRILISVWKRDQKKFQKKADKNGDVYHTWRGKYERFYHLFTKDELETIVCKSGFLIEKCWIEDDNIWLVAKPQP